ncbi:MAG: hypothetical protein PHH47_09655 [Gallionella sp.]|nr:hypothetical protein [Gallionella sp.]MDD4946650.1 hypothetical protein [Gallionella sp.]MDD5611923.1 hypothetical protein [Gallionella sp.]
MQFQMVITALILSCLFAIPAQAIEEDENKKKRAVAKAEQVTPASASATRQTQAASSKVEDDSDCESIPASFYKKLDMSSF